MAKCSYCQKDAGFLQRKHKDCYILYKRNKIKIEKLLYSAFFGTEDMKSLKNRIIVLAKEAGIQPKELDAIYIANYNKIVKQFLYDGVLTYDEELKLTEFKNEFNFDQEFLDQHGLFQKFIKAVVVRDVAKGKVPNVDFDSNLPIELPQGEKIVWLFDEVELYENKKVGSKTISTWKVKEDEEELLFSSVFSNDKVKTKKMKLVDTGALIITNKSSYFVSTKEHMKINIKNVSSLVPYQDGVGFASKGNEKSFHVFKNLDGWFAYNVMFNLSR